jgi:hypothetical protein
MVFTESPLREKFNFYINFRTILAPFYDNFGIYFRYFCGLDFLMPFLVSFSDFWCHFRRPRAPNGDRFGAIFDRNGSKYIRCFRTGDAPGPSWRRLGHPLALETPHGPIFWHFWTSFSRCRASFTVFLWFVWFFGSVSVSVFLTLFYLLFCVVPFSFSFSSFEHANKSCTLLGPA